MTKRILAMIGLFLLTSCSNSPTEYSLMEIVPGDAHSSSYVAYHDKEGNLIKKEKLPKEEAVGYGYFKQQGNLVYFDNAYPSAHSMMVYDYDQHELVKLHDLDQSYEYINPFSEKVILTYNDTVSIVDDSISWQKLDANTRISGSVVFKDKIYVYCQPYGLFPQEDKIQIYDNRFKILSEIEITKLGLLSGYSVDFYQSENQLFIVGNNLEKDIEILRVNEELQVLDSMILPNSADGTVMGMFEKSPGDLYLEVASSLIRLQLKEESMEIVEAFNIDDNKIVGMNFQEEKFFLSLINPQSEKTTLTIYDMDMNFLKSYELERHRRLLPRLIDDVIK